MAPKIKYLNIIKKLKEVSKIDVEPVLLVTEEKEECPDCAIDPINQSSTNPFCPTCHGSGFVIEIDAREVSVNVEYSSGGEIIPGIAGTLKEGQVALTIITDELEKVGVTPTDFFTDAYPVDYVVLNGTRYKIVRVFPGKLQGILYEWEIIMEPVKG
jgi:hypothetical protein